MIGAEVILVIVDQISNAVSRLYGDLFIRGKNRRINRICRGGAAGLGPPSCQSLVGQAFLPDQSKNKYMLGFIKAAPSVLHPIMFTLCSSQAGMPDLRGALMR